MLAMDVLTTNQAVGSSTSREAAQNAGFAGGPEGARGVARVISPGAPFFKDLQLFHAGICLIGL
jgi:hypothetical protein